MRKSCVTKRWRIGVAATTLVSALAYDFFKVSQELHAGRTLMRIEAIEAAMAEVNAKIIDL
jgi:hypothetical protein